MLHEILHAEIVVRPLLNVLCMSPCLKPRTLQEAPSCLHGVRLHLDMLYGTFPKQGGPNIDLKILESLAWDPQKGSPNLGKPQHHQIRVESGVWNLSAVLLLHSPASLRPKP